MEGARVEGMRGWRVHVPTRLDGKRDVRLRVAARTRSDVYNLHLPRRRRVPPSCSPLNLSLLQVEFLGSVPKGEREREREREREWGATLVII